MKYLIANWKMNHTVAQGIEYLKEYQSLQPKISKTKVLIAPSYTSFFPLSQIIQKETIPVSLCAQNICEFKRGAYTGEVSAEMIQEIGCKYVLLGHSERRHLFHESNESINKKYQMALDYSLIPIICFGETLPVYQTKKTVSYITEQLLFLKGEKPPIFAYEPVWSIGSGLIPRIDEIETIVDFMKQNFPASSLLYGGSVNPETIQSIAKIEGLDGFLVGGASLQAVTFIKLLSSFENPGNDR
jgi:triosephosphate isomerase (TIM)